jgi:L-ribulokinase
LLGLEAGQSAFGDVYAWFGRLLLWPVSEIISGMTWLDEQVKARISYETADQMIAELSRQAESLADEETALVALDWLNGRRTPYANQELKGAITGLSLGSDAPRMLRRWLKLRLWFRMINDGLFRKAYNCGVIAIGRVAKNPYVMQIVADVMNMPIKVARSDQACAWIAMASVMAASIKISFSSESNGRRIRKRI